MHRPLFLITAGSVAACGALIFATALPAAAATSVRAEEAAPTAVACTPPALGGCGDTPLTFTVTTTGLLGIGVPASADLGSVAVGATTIGGVGDFGTVTVTDNRALNPASWTASVYSTDFVNGTNAVDVIPVSAATYLTGPVIPTPDSGLPGAGSTAVSVHTGTAIVLGNGPTGQPVVTETNYDGDNSTQWSPEIEIHIPATAVLGVYTGTVTHSVT